MIPAGEAALPQARVSGPSAKAANAEAPAGAEFMRRTLLLFESECFSSILDDMSDLSCL
jgi:hypothetical protein